ncbi:hypothetical protein ARMGADRAFT_1074198 [Armillaria gallica]|uniref:Uncharacterized protein n=1 Tax=Armillaria gallica TaxID=47427 RepID=A0A2H3E850_ARMGA|nr:hypothetical protein ARMGADRAFT_1074198 [Armillaria gallica]
MSLGIPSATLLSIVLILTIRFRYRPLQRIETPHTAPTVTTDDPTNNVDAILLKQQLPQILAPIPWQPIPIDEFARSGIWEEEEVALESAAPIIPERRTPAASRGRMPVITISSPEPPDTASYVSQPPSPSTDDAPPPPASIAPDEFWDNVNLPLSAYFPSNHNLPGHHTPSPTGARNLTMWIQPIQNQEFTPEPVRPVEEPIAGDGP